LEAASPGGLFHLSCADIVVFLAAVAGFEVAMTRFEIERD
jgi:hypothetical protein